MISYLKPLISSILILLLNLFPIVQAGIDCDREDKTYIPKSECETLRTLYDSTDGPNWRKLGEKTYWDGSCQ